MTKLHLHRLAKEVAWGLSPRLAVPLVARRELHGVAGRQVERLVSIEDCLDVVSPLGQLAERCKREADRFTSHNDRLPRSEGVDIDASHHRALQRIHKTDMPHRLLLSADHQNQSPVDRLICSGHSDRHCHMIAHENIFRDLRASHRAAGGKVPCHAGEALHNIQDPEVQARSGAPPRGGCTELHYSIARAELEAPTIA